jgi:hypothetical protein
MTTLQIIMVVIMYVLLLTLIGQLVYICVSIVLDDVKNHDYELTPLTVTMFGIMIMSMVVIGLLPILH